MNIGHLLKQLPAWWGEAEWATKAFKKYFLTDSELLGYYYSSDFDPERDASEKHDREDDLFVVTKSFLTAYRLNTTGLRHSDSRTEAEAQSLEKTIVPAGEISSVKMSWSSTGAFAGEAPPEDQRSVALVIKFRREFGKYGTSLEFPLRDADVERDRELAWHQTETFAEAVLLALEESKEPGSTLNLTEPEQ